MRAKFEVVTCPGCGRRMAVRVNGHTTTCKPVKP